MQDRDTGSTNILILHASQIIINHLVDIWKLLHEIHTVYPCINEHRVYVDYLRKEVVVEVPQAVWPNTSVLLRKATACIGLSHMSCRELMLCCCRVCVQCSIL